MNAALIDPRFPDGIPVPVTAVSAGQVDGDDAVTFTCFTEPNEVYKHKNFATEVALLAICSEWIAYIKVGSLFCKDRYGDITIVSEADDGQLLYTNWNRVPGGYHLIHAVYKDKESIKVKKRADLVKMHDNTNVQTALF